MNLSLYIAKRYLFSKKSHNAINIISMISVGGIIVATIAMICTLSVFNGFAEIPKKSYSAFDPDIKITPKLGKVFEIDAATFDKIQCIPEVELISASLEENALLKFEDRQEPMLLVGVSQKFQRISQIDSLIIDGEFALRSGDIDFGVIGAGLATTLGSHPGFIAPLEIYIPKRNERVNPANPASSFKRANVFVAGVFALNQEEYDNQMLLVSIDLVRELLNYDKEISSLDIKIGKGENISRIQSKLKDILGDKFHVKNQFEQKENIYKWVSIEKWVTFFMLAIIAAIAIFNVVGSLSMLIIEKKRDLKILQSMGANDNTIANIFMYEGRLIILLGSTIGLLLGLAICLAQEHFGILRLAEAGSFVIDSYPVFVSLTDTIIVFVTVNVIGALAVIYPVSNLRNNLKSDKF